MCIGLIAVIVDLLCTIFKIWLKGARLQLANAFWWNAAGSGKPRVLCYILSNK
jgi:hypothetical protein